MRQPSFAINKQSSWELFLTVRLTLVFFVIQTLIIFEKLKCHKNNTRGQQNGMSLIWSLFFPVLWVQATRTL